MPRKKERAGCKFLPLSDLPTNVPPVLKMRLAQFTTAKPQESEEEAFVRLDRIIIFSQMIRDRWYSKYRYSERPKADEDQKGYKLRSELFCKTLDLIQEVHLVHSINPTNDRTVWEWFILVVYELQIDALHFTGHEIASKSQARKILQAQNRQIKAYENPFSCENSRATYLLLEAARSLAQVMDKFRENYYTPFRQAREALTTHLIGKALLYKKHGKGFSPSRQGKTSTKSPQKKIKPSP